jgi:hypothetical protein
MMIPKYPGEPFQVICYPQVHDEYYRANPGSSFDLEYPQTVIEVILPFTPKGRIRNRLWVRKESISLYAAPNIRAPVLISLPEGIRLELLGKEGAWYRVIMPGLEGWVHQLSVSKKAPK